MNDELTGLLNWEAFRLLVEHELRVARRTRRHDTLLVVGIDELASIYETGGDDEGDQTVRAVGRLLADTARDSDVVARIGRDAFAIFALDCEGSALAERISNAVAHVAESAANAVAPHVHALAVGMRIGITEVRVDDDFEPLMGRALTVLPKNKPARNGLAASNA